MTYGCQRCGMLSIHYCAQTMVEMFIYINVLFQKMINNKSNNETDYCARSICCFVINSTFNSIAFINRKECYSIVYYVHLGTLYLLSYIKNKARRPMTRGKKTVNATPLAGAGGAGHCSLLLRTVVVLHPPLFLQTPSYASSRVSAHQSQLCCPLKNFSFS